MVSAVLVQKSSESGQIMPQMPDVLEANGYCFSVNVTGGRQELLLFVLVLVLVLDWKRIRLRERGRGRIGIRC